MNEEPGRRTAAAGATSVARNAFWRFLEISGAEIISFGFMVLLARILAPADFGVIAMATGMPASNSTSMPSVSTKIISSR